MSALVRSYLRFLGYLDFAVKWFCTVIAGAMAVTVLIQVVSRYLPTPTPPWTEELARYFMIYMAFVGASSGIRKWNNISVDFILTKLPQRWYKVSMFVMQVIVLALVIYIGSLGVKVFPKIGLRQTSATMGFPMFVPQSAIIVGCFLMALQLIGLLIAPLSREEETHV